MNTINNNKTRIERCTICNYFNDGLMQGATWLRKDPDSSRDSYVCEDCYDAIKGAYLDYEQDTFRALEPSVKQKLWNTHHYPHREDTLPPGELEGLKRQYRWTTAGSRTKKPTLAPVKGLETEGGPLDRCLKGPPGAVQTDLEGGMGGSSQEHKRPSLSVCWGIGKDE